MRKIISSIFGLIFLGFFGYILMSQHVTPLPILNTNQVATNATTTDYGLVSITDINNDYIKATTTPTEKVRILIVPGHEPDYGGAQFDSQYGTIYERNLNVELGQDLEQFIQTDNHFQVDITRDTKSWTPVFADYFNNNFDAIKTWIKTSKKNSPKISSYLTQGQIIHNSAPANVATRLFGITKWSNENNVDLMIHIHFNDYPGHRSSVAGKYSGLVIYVPSAQYLNSSTTTAIAQNIFKRLSMYNPISNLKIESNGLIDDSSLIAIGANNTSDAASMLIEYDYIYQNQVVNPKLRSLALKDFAYQTYLGLQDYFNQTSTISPNNAYNPSNLYIWNGLGVNKNSNPEDIYALQTALMMDGDYPPTGKNKNICPHSGTFGPCTASALNAFQTKNNITNENKIVGPKSFSILNIIYSGKVAIQP